jgi:hypothetical protein
VVCFGVLFYEIIMPPQFLNPAGGLFYHAKAVLYAATLWPPFRQNIREWLQRWKPPEKKIVIIGASGGYTLNEDFLGNFVEIIAVDPDPVAALVFKRRFATRTSILQWDAKDYFVQSGCTADPFRKFLDCNSDAAVLFANFLGQMPFLINDEKKREAIIRFWQTNLLPALHGRSWASFHDRYSSSRIPVQQGHAFSICRLSGDALIKRYYGEAARGKWVDHRTEGLFHGQHNYDYFLWQLTPRAFHIIEALFYRIQ